MSKPFDKRRRRLSFSMEELAIIHAAFVKAWQYKLPQTVDLMDRIQKALAEEADPDHRVIVDTYRAAIEPKDDEIELDDDAEVSLSEDGGAYVMVWKWVDAEEAGLCRSCHAPFSDGGDGFDGECPDCADLSNQEKPYACENCGNTLNDGSDICDQCCGSFVSSEDQPKAIKEALATLYAVKERLEMNNYGGEEDPFIGDCETAIALLEPHIIKTKDEP